MIQTRLALAVVLTAAFALPSLSVATGVQAAELKRGMNTLRHFRGYEGNMPATALVRDGTGGFLGTTSLGGGGNPGTIYRLLSPLGEEKRWSVQRLIKFNDASTGDGNNPNTTLVPDGNGNWFGTTFMGGNDGRGTVFILKPPREGETTWKRRIIHAFSGGPAGGERPMGQLILTADGNLLGTTYLGGEFNAGTIFMLTPPPAGNVWSFILLRSLRENGLEGGFPQAGLIGDTKGNYYGTTTRGGPSDRGTIYLFRPPAPGSDQWRYTTLYNFPDNGTPGTGGLPMGNLLLFKGGLYGVTSAGGTANLGTVFRLAKEGQPKIWQHTELHAFGTFAEDGINPEAALIHDGRGGLWGTTKLGGPTNHGIIFKATRSAGTDNWDTTIMHTFSGGDGAQPVASLMMLVDAFYGTTSGGGKYNRGTAFAFKP